MAKIKKENNKKKDNMIIIYAKCMKLIFKYSKTYIPVSIVSMSISSIMPAISMLIMQNMVNVLQTFEKIYYLKQLLLAYILLDIFEELVNSIYSVYNSKFSLQFEKKIKIKLFEKSMLLSLEDYENSEIYDVIDRAKLKNGQDVLTFYNTGIEILGTIIKIVSSVLIVSRFNIWILPIILIMPILQYCYLVKVGKMQYDIQIHRTGEERKLWYIDYLIMTGNAYKELKLYNFGQELIKQYEEKKDSFNKVDIKIIKKVFQGKTIIMLCDQIVNGSLFAYLLFCKIKNSEKYNGKDEYVILKYGFQTILEVLICSVSCITIAYFLNMFWECIMLLGIFLLLRSYSGGIHLKKFYQCYICSNIVIITILLLSKSKILSCRVSMAIDTIFSVYILYTKPIGVLDEEELAYFKKKIEKRIIIINLINMLFLLKNKLMYCSVIAYGLIGITVSMFLGKISDL